MNNKLVNGWPLFWLITAPISVAMVIATAGADLASGEGISAMIQFSVRCAVPLLFLVFSASALQTVLPNTFSRWLLRNRKIFGLCFAAAMAWQLLFILWMVGVYSDYYVNEVYVLRDAIEGVVGYLLLIAMAVTSFKFARKHMTQKQWKRLHWIGIYFLWAYAFSVYWWNLSYYEGPQVLDYVFYFLGFLAWVLRAAAWAKTHKPEVSSLYFKLIGGLVIFAGLIGSVSGRAWQPLSEHYLSGYSVTTIPELYLPYWPFDPFLPLFLIGLGILIACREKVTT